MKYTADGYRLYVAADNANTFLVLDHKTEDRYLIFDWDLSDEEIEEIAGRFYGEGLDDTDLNSDEWQIGDFRDEMNWAQEADDYVKAM